MQDILSLNKLEQSDSLVYVSPGASAASFDYSDGAEVEKYLFKVLSSANDLGCRSPELQAKIIDWPSEYHLSSDRSNLLRPYDLSNVKRVLELGSGCGAISRYLGEQGLTVDAVEGSVIRANLGKLRCKDLDNVRVINANYNDLEFPAGHYDLVLFVGVIEYARKFHPDAESDREAALHILQQAGQYIHEKGAVLVAIENRLGLKYMLGAHEDHYARRYIGINDYRDSAGIATYSRRQWNGLIKQAGFSHKAVSYPFPDYKIPSVVLSENYVNTSLYVNNHLEDLLSRDYHAPVKRTPTEAICWQAASQGGFIRDVANSFCLLMGNDGETIRQIQAFDFCHGPGSSRKNRFAVKTSKASDSALVEKDQEQTSLFSSSEGVTQRLTPQGLIKGDLLSGQWLRTILIYVRRQEFEQALRAYFEFLTEEEQTYSLTIDLLPINIIVRPDGQWQVFDQEWGVDWKITKEFVLFRALLTFIVNNWVYLRDFLSWLELQTVRDFIEYGFHANQIHLGQDIEQFIEMENRFQRAIARDPESKDVNFLLNTVFDFTSEEDNIYSSVLWRYEEEAFTDTQQTEVSVSASPGLFEIAFDINAEQPVAGLRFDPFDLRRDSDVGFYRMESISLIEELDGISQCLWSIDGASEIARLCQADNTAFQTEGEEAAWMATTDFPKMVFAIEPAVQVSPQAKQSVVVSIAIIRSKEYAMAYKHYLVESRSHQKKIERMDLNLTSLKTVCAYLGDKLEAEETRANRLDGDLRNTQREIEAIKQSKPFLLSSKIVGAVNNLRKLVGR